MWKWKLRIVISFKNWENAGHSAPFVGDYPSPLFSLMHFHFRENNAKVQNQLDEIFTTLILFYALKFQYLRVHIF